MTAAPTYDVRLAEMGWAVSEGAERARATLPSKRAAITEAYRLAAARASARVVVHCTDNTVEREYLFHGESRPVRRS